MRILGADLPRPDVARGAAVRTLIRIDDDGRVDEIRRPSSLPELVTEVGRLVHDEVFLLGVDIPVVVPQRNAKTRAVENVLRRRLGHRLPPGGRASLQAQPDAATGETLLASLAAAGHACLGYPERDRRTSGLAEVHPGPVLESLLWQGSTLATAGRGAPDRAEALIAYSAPPFRRGEVRGRTTWRDRAATLDMILRALGRVPLYDLDAVRESLAACGDEADLDRSISLLDAVLIAGTVLRYLESPETCVFAGQRDAGYVILPADTAIRRQVLKDGASAGEPLFPATSLRERLAGVASVRSLDLLPVAGRPERIEASFEDPPILEFDNVDEMLWWKHTRHLSGPALPTEGLQELLVHLGRDGGGSGNRPLRLVRSRHKTLSFRFDRPAAWRAQLPTRDGGTYALRVVQAVYEVRDDERGRRHS